MVRQTDLDKICLRLFCYQLNSIHLLQCASTPSTTLYMFDKMHVQHGTHSYSLPVNHGLRIGQLFAYMYRFNSRYDWLASNDNVILLGSCGAFVGLLVGTCMMCVWRYHRVGRCLPLSCPTVKMCR